MEKNLSLGRHVRDGKHGWEPHTKTPRGGGIIEVKFLEKVNVTSSEKLQFWYPTGNQELEKLD